MGPPALAALGLALAGAGPAAAQCTTTIGVVMELTGPAGQFGQAGSKAVELAFRDLNEAGGAAGCRLAAEIRDAQSQGTVAVDAAKQLVEIKRVPAILGGIISSVSIPILTSVTAPAGVVQISPASSSPTLTNLGREGKSGGWFFRTITTDALQGVAAAKYALDLDLRRLSVIHVNNDFGVNMVREFSKAYPALGGHDHLGHPLQPEPGLLPARGHQGAAGTPDALYLVSYPVDGATIARTWISQGGVKKFLLNDGMNSAKFIQDVGAAAPERRLRTSSGTTKTPSTEYFAREYPAFAKPFEAGAPAADRSYDAAAILGLAIAQAGKAEPAAIRDAIRKVLDPRGTVVHAGAAEFRKALGLLKEGKPIRYVGVIGPVQFDRFGDITGPFRLWRIQNGEVRRPARCRRRTSTSSRPSSSRSARGRPRPPRGSRAAMNTPGPPVEPAPPRRVPADTPRRRRHGHGLGGRGGLARAVRVGDRILVSGTTATGPDGVVGTGDAAAQARFILEKIERAIAALGANSGTWCARGSTCTPAGGLAGRGARPRGAVRDDPAGQHARAGRPRRRAVPRRDRGRGGDRRRGCASVSGSITTSRWPTMSGWPGPPSRPGSTSSGSRTTSSCAALR